MFMSFQLIPAGEGTWLSASRSTINGGTMTIHRWPPPTGYGMTRRPCP